jgi:hypothetical protein
MGTVMTQTATPMVGRCKLKGPETRVESAWFPRLELNYDKLVSSFASNFNCAATHWERRIAEQSIEAVERLQHREPQQNNDHQARH